MPLGNRALLDDGGHRSTCNGLEWAGYELRRIDQMGAYIAQRAGAHRALVAPCHGGAGITSVIAPVASIDMGDLTEVAFLGQLGNFGEGGIAAEGETNRRDNSGFLLGFSHRLGVFEGISDWLLAQDVLARSNECLGDFAVQSIAHDDRYDIDLGVFGHLLPVVYGIVVSVALGGIFREWHVRIRDGVKVNLR